MGKVVKAVVGIALVVAIAAFAPALGAAFLTAIGTATATAMATAAATALAASVLAVAGGMLMMALSPGPKTAGSQPFNFRNSVSNSFIIVGKRRQGGKLIFYHPSKVLGSHYRHFIWAAAGHRCKGVVRWWLNDEEVTVDGAGLVTSGKYAGNAWLWFGRGSYDTDETPAGWRAATGGKWTTDHVGYGVAKLFCKFKMTKEVVEAGMPTMTAEIEGSDEIYDPRSEATGYVRNAILAFYWWLRLAREEGGFGASDDEMPDDDLVSAWANICDEACDDGNGGTEDRYAFDSLIETGATPSQVRQTFITCCAGSFTYSEGQFLLRPGYWTPPTATLSEHDLAGGIGVSPMLLGEEVATEVNGTYVDPDSKYQPQPVPTRSIDSVDVRQVDIDLAHVTSHARGQRILEIILRRAQCEKRVSWPMNIAGIATRAMQSVQLGTARYGLSNYAWIIDNWGLSQDFGVSLKLREENEDIYAEPALKPKAASATPAVAEDIPVEADTAASAETSGEVSDGTISYTPTQIKDLEDRIAALETP